MAAGMVRMSGQRWEAVLPGTDAYVRGRWGVGAAERGCAPLGVVRTAATPAAPITPPLCATLSSQTLQPGASIRAAPLTCLCGPCLAPPFLPCPSLPCAVLGCRCSRWLLGLPACSSPSHSSLATACSRHVSHQPAMAGWLAGCLAGCLVSWLFELLLVLMLICCPLPSCFGGCPHARWVNGACILRSFALLTSFLSALPVHAAMRPLAMAPSADENVVSCGPHKPALLYQHAWQRQACPGEPQAAFPLLMALPAILW